jgi:hypothetical protein
MVHPVFVPDNSVVQESIAFMFLSQQLSANVSVLQLAFGQHIVCTSSGM